jgi:predicted RNA binding protein YcfA (HicA-like mRNA interferase family)
VNRRRLLARLARNPNNVAFRDFVDLIQAFGFEHRGIKGSHRTFEREGVREIVDVQSEHGEAKPYQVRQFLKLTEKYNLELED